MFGRHPPAEATSWRRRERRPGRETPQPVRQADRGRPVSEAPSASAHTLRAKSCVSARSCLPRSAPKAERYAGPPPSGWSRPARRAACHRPPLGGAQVRSGSPSALRPLTGALAALLLLLVASGCAAASIAAPTSVTAPSVGRPPPLAAGTSTIGTPARNGPPDSRPGRGVGRRGHTRPVVHARRNARFARGGSRAALARSPPAERDAESLRRATACRWAGRHPPFPVRIRSRWWLRAGQRPGAELRAQCDEPGPLGRDAARRERGLGWRRSWPRDHRRIAFERNVGRDLARFAMSSDGSQPTMLTHLPGVTMF